MIRTHRIVTAVGVGAAALVLAGCSTDLHPGNAAVVDGTRITQSHIDDVTNAVCSYVVEAGKQGGQPQEIGIADLKSSLTSTLVQFEITRQLAEERGLSVSQAQIDAQAARFGLPTGLSAADEKLVQNYFDEAAEATLLQALIGANDKDPSVTDASDLTQAEIDAQKPFMNAYFEAANVDVNPAYGSWNGKSVEAGSGSLSAEVATPSTALPDDQKCH